MPAVESTVDGPPDRGASADAPSNVPFAGVDAEEWCDLVLQGQESGAVHAEDLTRVLRHVELTGDVLEQVQTTMEGHGIVIDVEVEPVVDDTPSGIGHTLVI